MIRQPARLHGHLAIPVEPQPAEIVEGLFGSPGLEVLKVRQEFGDHPPGFRGEKRRRLLVQMQRTVGVDVPGALDQLDQRLGPLLQSRHRRNEFPAQCRGHFGLEFFAGRDVGEQALDFIDQLRVRGLPDVMPVEVLELGEIETCGRAADVREVERRDHLLGRKDFLIAVAPSQPHEVIAHGRR